MISYFIFDLTGYKMPDPDDIHDSELGKWKERKFGAPFDYTAKKTQNQLRKFYLIERPIELVIVVEGETEEKVIELILQARGVDLERDGFFVYNMKGLDNLVHLKPLFRISQLIDIIMYAMIDNDKDVDKKVNRMNEVAKNLGYNKEIIIRIWDRDFETENFGIPTTVSKVNQILDEKKYARISISEVEKRMESSGDALIKAIENVIGQNNYKNHKDIEPSIILSKPRLAELLIRDRLSEIQILKDPNWTAKLPIEFELKKAFQLIPNPYFA